MMIEAWVHSEERVTDYGMFRFAVLPVPGDRISLAGMRGAAGMLVVLYVEHHPIILPVSSRESQDPSVSICVRFMQAIEEEPSSYYLGTE